MLTNIKPTLAPILDSIARPFTFLHPNILSVIGVTPYLLFFYFLKDFPVLALLFSVGFCFDFVDGAVARLTNKQSAFGGILDSTLDRLTDAILIYSFAYAGIVSWELTSLVAISSILISYVRSRAELAAKGSITLAIGIVERTERILLILISLILIIIFPNFHLFAFNLAEITFSILLLLSIFTLYQRLNLAYKLTKNLK